MAAHSGRLVLQTPRLELRHLQARDLDALAAMYADEETRRYFPDGTLTREQTARELAHFAHGHPQHPQLGLWATVERASGIVIGRCSLLNWRINGRDEVELACLIDRARWRRGYASEAARAIVDHARDVLRLARLIALITPGNAASMRTAQTVDMHFAHDWVDEWGLCHVHALALHPPAPQDRPPTTLCRPRP